LTTCTRAFAGLLLTASLFASAAPAGAQTLGGAEYDLDQTIPISGVSSNPSNGERIGYLGAIRINGHVSVDSSGGMHIRYHSIGRADGIGLTTGVAYELIEVGSDSEYADSDSAPLVATGARVFNVISHGPTPNFQLFTLFHLTVTAGGQLSVFFDVYDPRG
jgi:hypothetical protein